MLTAQEPTIITESLENLQKVDKNVIQEYLEGIVPDLINFAVQILLAVLLYLVGKRVVSFIRKFLRRSLERRSVDIGVRQFLDSVSKYSLYAILWLMILTLFGITTASVIALLGSAGLTLGLALQGSLANFVGGVLILLLKPFKVGDYIKEDTNGNEGTVISIELFYTKLATPDNRVIVLPNGTLANSSLTNVTACESRRLDIKVGISYDADIRQAKEVLQKVLDRDEAVIKEMDHFVYVDELAESAVNLGIRCWLSTDDFWQGKWRLTENVKYALDEAGISIPYPQMDIHCCGKSN